MVKWPKKQIKPADLAPKLTAKKELAQIRYFHFKPFAEDIQVVGMTFKYDAEIVQTVKQALNDVQVEQGLKKRPGSYLGWCKVWWVAKDNWDDVKRKIEQKYTLLFCSVPERVANDVANKRAQRSSKPIEHRYDRPDTRRPQVLLTEGKVVHMQVPLDSVAALKGMDLVLDVKLKVGRASKGDVTTHQLSAVIDAVDDENLPF